MYAIAFDMIVDNLKKHYGDPYNNAYYEIEQVLKAQGFDNHTQGSLYLASPDLPNPLRAVYAAISSLKAIGWFRESVRDIRVFKVEDWSDFTEEFRK